jgi:acyl carrier protein
VLTEIIGDTLDVDDLVLTPDTTATDVPGWDSLKMVSIIIAIEARFHIRIRSSEIDTLKTVGDLAGVIRTKVA